MQVISIDKTRTCKISMTLARLLGRVVSVNPRHVNKFEINAALHQEKSDRRGTSLWSLPALPHLPILPVLLALLVLRAGPCFAWEVANRVIIEHGELVIDRSKSIGEITRAQAKGGFPAEYGLGLFQNRFKAELAFDQPEAAGKAKRLSMTTRIKTLPIIYIAREIPQDSCGYGVVLGHERLHQLYDLEVLRQMPGEIRGMTQTIFNVDELEREGTRSLERSRERFFQQLKYVYEGLSNPLHQTIDNQESYRRLGTQCNGEIANRLAGKSP